MKLPARLRKLADAWGRFDFSGYEPDHWILFRDTDGTWVVARNGDPVAELDSASPRPVKAWAASVVARDGLHVTGWADEGDEFWSAELSEVAL